MTAAASKPADTTMMSVVHDALRRDLHRLDTTLASTTPGDDQRRALGEHAVWMMDFLHHHHASEDNALWPLVRSRQPSTAALLDRMQADHSRVLPAIDDVLEAAGRYRDGDHPDLRRTLGERLTALEDVLLPHLRAEEDEAMPAVAASLTDAEWKAWDKANNVDGKSIRQLAVEGHWLMDGLDPVRYQVLMHLVPAPARVVIVHGFARSYRKACARRWGPGVKVGPLPRHPQRD